MNCCDNWFTHILIPSGAEARSLKWPWHSVCCMFKKLYINNLEQKSLSMKQIALLAGPASRRNRNISSFLHSSRWFPADGVLKLPSEKLKTISEKWFKIKWNEISKEINCIMGCTYALKWQISPNSTRTLKIFAKEVQFLQAVDEKQDWFVREIYGDKQQWFRPPLKRAYWHVRCRGWPFDPSANRHTQ